MAVTETLRALGSWSLGFKGTLPENDWKKIDYFGHVVIHVGNHPGALDDSLLRSARYVGVLQAINDNEGSRGIGGAGMASWLGDSDGKGDIFVNPLVLNGTFQSVIRASLPASGAVTEGTLFNIGETFGPSTFQFQDPRSVIDYICQTIDTDVAWRVNGDATLDAGRESDLFVVNPQCVVVRKRVARTVAGFDDMFMRGLAGMANTDRDVKDYGTGVVLLAQGVNGQFVQQAANLTPPEILHKDLHGNPVKLVRIIQESDTEAINAPARALLQLNRFKGTRDALTLTTSNYDIKGTAQVGDYIWTFDPQMGLADLNNEIVFRGQRINPLKLRLTEVTWPVTNKMSVFYRTGAGEWIDLTKHFAPETGDTALVVGGYNRSLSDGGSGTFPITAPEENTTVPSITEWDLPFSQSMYQSPGTGETRSEVELKWFKPNNTDSSTLTDLSHYDIRYRTSSQPFYLVTINDVAPLSLAELNTVQDPVNFGPPGDWVYAAAPADVLRFRVQELMPSTPYEAQIRAVDHARPPNYGAWSDMITFQTSRDLLPPAVPAAPEAIGNPMAVLFKHYLGKASGGQFNLDRDLHHLEFHGSPDPLFHTSPETLLGKILANWGMITGEIPVVGSFQITAQVPLFYRCVAVDEAGNKSLDSPAVEQVAGLIDNQYVRNLTVDKVTAGTISADWIIGSYIRTAKTGARVEMSWAGIDGYDALGQRRLNWDSTTGQLRVIGAGGIAVTGGGNVEITNGAVVVYNAAGNKIIEMGECADGRHGLQVYTDAGVRVTRVGEIVSGSEGIEVISDSGQLVRVSTLAFGIMAATTAGVLSTTSNVYSGSSPAITGVEIGTSGRAIVSISASCGFPVAATGGSATFAGAAQVGGATVPVSDTHALSAIDNFQSGRSFLLTGLSPGLWNFSMAYESTVNGNQSQWFNRHIIVQPF